MLPVERYSAVQPEQPIGCGKTALLSTVVSDLQLLQQSSKQQARGIAQEVIKGLLLAQSLL